MHAILLPARQFWMTKAQRTTLGTTTRAAFVAPFLAAERNRPTRFCAFSNRAAAVETDVWPLPRPEVSLVVLFCALPRRLSSVTGINLPSKRPTELNLTSNLPPLPFFSPPLSRQTFKAPQCYLSSFTTHISSKPAYTRRRPRVLLTIALFPAVDPRIYLRGQAPH
jgi:hypothetical protein